MKKINRLAFTTILALVLLTACNLPLGNQGGNVDENAVNTQVAQTVQAAQGGNTIVITATPQGDQTIPTITPVTLPTLVNATTPPTLTATPDTCNQAQFVTDVTIPDGSSLFAGSSFVKTWRIKNIGTCAWNTNYALVTVSGDDLGAPAVMALPANVPPGGTIDLSVNLVAPATNGKYQQNFKLRSDTGLLFATGVNAAYPLYVQIQVIHFYALTLMPTLDLGSLPLIPLEISVYNFAGSYCAATWKNSSLTVLPCPGTTSDATGFIVRNDSPHLQDGKQYSGPTLFTHPQWVDNGTIAGFYPAIAIQNGYHFRTTLGCGQGGSACDAQVQLNYSSDGGPTKNFTTWMIKYGDAPTVVDLDLSSLAGHNVAFILAVSANGTSAQDWIQWVNPRIIK
jgi:Ig-like domain from next to BRCA1 gene